MKIYFFYYFLLTYNEEALVWIEATTIPDSSFATIYMYYGNAGASAAGNFMDTFHSTSDDFEDSSLAPKWTWYNEPVGTGATWDEGSTTSGWFHVVSEKSTNMYKNQDDGHYLYQELSGNFEIEVKIYSNPYQNAQQSGILIRQDSNNFIKFGYGYYYMLGVGGKGVSVWKEVNNNNTLHYPTEFSASPVYVKITRIGDNWYARYHLNGTTTWSAPVNGGNWTQALTDPLKIGVGVGDGGSLALIKSNYTSNFAYFKVREYVSPEPAITIGSEEAL